MQFGPDHASLLRFSVPPSKDVLDHAWSLRAAVHVAHDESDARRHFYCRLEDFRIPLSVPHQRSDAFCEAWRAWVAVVGQ